MNSVFWQLCRLWVRIRSGRLPPRQLADPIWYFAYGSNMNERLFRERRHMSPIETRIGLLQDYRLCFTAVGGMRPGVSAPANITQESGAAVPGVLYLLPLHKFVRLDASEGQQYAYLWTEVVDADGASIPVVTFKVTIAAPEERPSLPYLNIIREAARQRGLPPEYVTFLNGVEARE